MRVERENLDRLFGSFLRLGLTAFGGPAMVACLRDLAVKKNEWIWEESFRRGVAMCQSIPGVTAMQVAAYVGLRAGGPLGALAIYVGFDLCALMLKVDLFAFGGGYAPVPLMLHEVVGVRHWMDGIALG